MNEAAYRVEHSFGACGWLSALWMIWRHRNGCSRIPCGCEWCGSFQDALVAESEKDDFERRFESGAS